eukprot:g2528.t1
MMVRTTTPVPFAQTTIRQSATLSGISMAEVEQRKNEIEGAIAVSLGLKVADVTITNIVAVDARRRLLLATLVQITYEIKVTSEASWKTMETKMKGSKFQTDLTTNIAAATGKPSLGVVVKAPITAVDAPFNSTTTTEQPKSLGGLKSRTRSNSPAASDEEDLLSKGALNNAWLLWVLFTVSNLGVLGIVY